MHKKLRILFIEDNEDDLILIQRVIKKEKYEIESLRVENQHDMLDALKKREFDVILCDYHMPHFGTIEALKTLKKTGLDIPLILVSGMIGEEAAVTVMKAGASDFVMKDRLARLVPAIEREIEDAKKREQLRRVQDDLSDSEEKYRQLIESNTDLVAKFDASDNLSFASKSFFNLFGKNESEMIGKHFEFNIHKEDIEKYVKACKALRNEPFSSYVEFRVMTNDGWVWLGCIKKGIIDDNENLVSHVVIARFLIERKRV